MKKKLILLTKSDINALPEYKGYINTDLKKKYKLYFIGENLHNNIKVTKEEFGISITLPKTKNRWKFYLKVFFIISKINPNIVHVFWFPLASLVALLSNITVKDYTVIGDFRTKSPFGGIKGKIKDIVLKIESLFFDKVITLDKELSNFIFKKEADCYIPMGYDNTLFKNYNLEKEYDFIYAGSISRDRKIFNFIKKFNEITNSKFKILVIGWGDEANKVEELTSTKVNISYLNKVSREEIPYYYSKSKIGISYVDKNVLNIQQPTKILEYIACDIGVLANNTIGTLELSSKLKFNGLIFSNLEELKLLNINNLESYNGKDINNYSWQNIIDNKLIPFYESLLK
jgi:hypothetical protein